MHPAYVIHTTAVICCCVQPTDEMLELASDKRDEAMAAIGEGWFHSVKSTFV